MHEYAVAIADETAMMALGAAGRQSLAQGGLVFLYGDLGLGKTTLCRGILRGLGVVGRVKSPTFSLVEEYPLEDFSVYHFDLYRLADSEELEYLGLRDCLLEQNLCLIEWPDKGAGFLPPADLELHFVEQGTGRLLKWRGCSEKGKNIAKQWYEHWQAEC